MVAELDPAHGAQIDRCEPGPRPARVEVLTATGRGIADWQDDTPPPLLAPDDCQRVLITSDRDWLADRIAARFHAMLDQGAREEVRAMLPLWDPAAQWAKAIGAPDLVAHLQGHATLAEATERAIIASRQYAKAQRVWFRGRMRDWQMWQAGNAPG